MNSKQNEPRIWIPNSIQNAHQSHFVYSIASIPADLYPPELALGLKFMESKYDNIITRPEFQLPLYYATLHPEFIRIRRISRRNAARTVKTAVKVRVNFHHYVVFKVTYFLLGEYQAIVLLKTLHPKLQDILPRFLRPHCWKKWGS